MSAAQLEIMLAAGVDPDAICKLWALRTRMRDAELEELHIYEIGYHHARKRLMGAVFVRWMVECGRLAEARERVSERQRAA
jgi:hypothetical protein